MRELVENLIQEIEKLPTTKYWEEMKDDILKELEARPSTDNQMLWLQIKLISAYAEMIVG